ncbi:HAMP domain-containing sensor histidine kinase [uncultured Roseobacter sp.]|uniref:sensor histidine kinase n=1 Tax=uncultured Roseobacter sp. TaxID=114847 RepID=UPI00260DCDB9|nr:HAMP domain-containing sensor histidine kinase [uncultured Roseobacter sp.]
MQRFEIDLLDLIDHAVFVLEPDDEGMPRYAAFNTFALNVIQRPLDDIIARTAAEVYGGRLGEIALDHHLRVLASGEPAVYEILLPLGGIQRLVRTALRPVTDAEGRVTRIFGSSTDMSGRQVMREVQTEMSALNGEMEDFINLAAHDLRAPMRNVSQIAEMLRDDFEDRGDGKLELIGMLEKTAKKTTALIGDVLSQAQAVTPLHETVQFEFSELVDEVAQVLDPMKHCVFHADTGVIEGDRTVFQIILRNLVDNAIKHGQPPAGSPENVPLGWGLELRLSLKDGGDGCVEVAISDNGTGFSDPALLFLDNGSLRVDSGFGLFGVRRLIYTRGGTLTATNLPDGQGAVVSFRLPGRIM